MNECVGATNGIIRAWKFDVIKNSMEMIITYLSGVAGYVT